MSKKLIRKGLAISATVALALTGFAALPANAAGLADTSFVSLVPKTGTEYAVPANANQTFTLTANEASSIEGTNRNLKFLVTDADAAVESTAATSGRGFTFANNSVVTVDFTTDIVTITDSAAAALLASNDRIVLDEDLTVDAFTGDGAITTAASSGVVFTVTKSGNDISFKSDLNLVISTGVGGGDTAGAINLDSAPAGAQARVVREARAADNSYVVDTGSFTASSTSDLVLTVAGGTTRTATVTAWVDNNGNDVIDPTEYVSPTRTISFLAAADITVTTTIDPLVLGATSLTAKISTTPVLNGNQFAHGTVTGVFTRQGSALEKTATAANAAAWNNTTKLWTVTQPLGGNSVWADASAAGAIASATYSSTTITVNTVHAHGLTTSDTVGIVGVTATTNAPNVSNVAVASVVDSDTFTFTAGATPTGTLGVSAASVTKFGSAVAGQYSAKGVITVNSVAKASTVTGATLGARAAVAVTNTVATSKDVANTSATAALVRTGVKTVSLSAAAEDVAEKAVGAGIPATITATFSSAGTVKVNGTTVTTGGVVNATTDASGKIAVSVENSAAVAGNAITIVVNVQGATSTTVFTWAAAEYALVDSADSSLTSSRIRAANKGGSYAFNLNVIDQWKQPLADGYRVQVAATVRTVSTTFHNIVGGRVSFSVADGGVTTGDTTVNVSVVSQGTAAALADAAMIDWTGASDNDIAAITIKWYDQTDVVTATGTTAAVDSLKTAALNKLTTTGFQAALSSAATISGSVSGSLTGLKRQGASITVSGPSTVLFNVGDVWAFGSLTFIDADGDYSVNAYSNVAMKDAVVTVSSNGASKTAKVTFTALTAVDAEVVANLSVKAGRSLNVLVRFLDKWDNLATGSNLATAKVSGAGWLTSETQQTAVDGVISLRLITQTEDYGIAAISATTNTLSTDGVNNIVATDAVWVGPIANAKAGGKKGSIVVETYRAKGKTVSVFVGSTRVATYVPTLQNHRKVVYVKNSGTRNVRVVLSGAGQDFRGAVTVK